MKKEEITIPEILKKEGYATGHFGKWHLETLSKTEMDANRGGEKFIDHYSIPGQKKILLKKNRKLLINYKKSWRFGRILLKIVVAG